MTVRKDYLREGAPVKVGCDSSGGENYRVRIDDVVHDVVAHRTPDGSVTFAMGGRTYLAQVAPAGTKGDVHVRLDGRTWRIKPHLGGRAGAVGAGSGLLEAPMTGTVLAVHVAVGDHVTLGQAVAVVTAMKMEHKITADVAGTVAEVGVKAGDTVDQGRVLVRITAEPKVG